MKSSMKTRSCNLLTSIDKKKPLWSCASTYQGTVIHFFKGNPSQTTFPLKSLPAHSVCVRDIWFMDSQFLDGEADFLLPWLLGSWFKVKLLPNQNQWQAQHLTARLLTTLGCLKVRDQSAAYCLWGESIFSIFLFCFFWKSSCCSITTYLGLAGSYKSLRKILPLQKRYKCNELLQSLHGPIAAHRQWIMGSAVCLLF